MWIAVVIVLICLILPSFVCFAIRSMSLDPPPLRIYVKIFRRDSWILLQMVKSYIALYYYYRRNYNVAYVFEKAVRAHPTKACLVFEGRQWTFQQVEDYSNQVANAFIKAGYKKGEEVSLLMHNRPEFVCIWLGLSKVGVATAFINTNLKGEALAHCINAVSTKAVISDTELIDDAVDIAPMLKNTGCDFYCLGPRKDYENRFSVPVKSLDDALKNESVFRNRNSEYETGFSDKLLYIFTSGTTGLPKAAVYRNFRLFMFAYITKYTFRNKGNDILYNALPLYHSAGGMLFMSFTLVHGCTTVLAKKFSASNFWSDVVHNNVTFLTYIGEMCRFLLAQPPNSQEKSHKVRMMVGNGLRGQLWTDFQKRFRVPRIIEYYGSTEGTASLVNCWGRAGAIGCIALTISKIYPVYLIKVDEDTMQPIRGINGLCVLCKPGEPGILVGRNKGNNPIFTFDGYSDKKENVKKTIRDCFRRGDQVYYSGDLVVMDAEGWAYFMDRTGDTFRWRGENVSTNQVEMLVSKAVDLSMCVVYGVEIPGAEGRAGMAAIQTNAAIDMTTLYQKLKACLPGYAVPIFIRLCGQLELTGTFKLQKVDLRNEGFDLEKVQDPIYVLNPTTQKYVTLDEEMYRSIIAGNVRF